MLEKRDIYGYDKQIAANIARLDKKGVSKRNKEIILRYKDELSLNNLSKARINKYLEILGSTAMRMNKDFDKITRADVEKFVAGINSKDYSPWTKQIYKLMLKRMLTWMNDGKIPEMIEWLKVHFNNSEKRLPG